MSNLLVPDLAAAFSQTLFGTNAQSYANPIRVPMSFTSTKRLRALNPNFAGTLSSFTDAKTSVEGLAQVGSFQDKSSSVDMPVITMKVNPHTIKFRQAKRIVKRDTRDGSIFYHFTDKNGANNDIMSVDFSGNTGSIDVRGDVPSTQGTFSSQLQGAGTGAIQKQLIWHNLWKLTREPMIILPDNIVNTFQIMYSSPIIPVQIALLGFFANTLEWTDSAEKPFSKDYSFSFTVQQTVPPLDELLTQIQSVLFDPSGFVTQV